MSSKVDICNLALSHLGMDSISNLSGTSPSQIACNRFFDTSRDDVFSEFAWPFANCEEELALLSDTVLGWIYLYAYPSKAARIWFVYNSSTVDNKDTQEFEVKYIPSLNTKVICTNTDTAYAEYTYKIEDTTLFSPKFVMLLSYRLASAMSHQLTGDVDLGLKLMSVYGAFLSDSKRVASIEKIKKPTQVSSYQQAR